MECSSRSRTFLRACLRPAALLAILFAAEPSADARSVQVERARERPPLTRRAERLTNETGRGRSGAAVRDPAESATLTCLVLDGSTLEPLPVRASVLDRDDKWRHPLPSSEYFYHGPAGKCGGYFFAEGAFTLDVPLGKTIVGAGHGFEYTTLTDTLYVLRDTSLVYTIDRWIDSEGLWWFSGDCHLHMEHAGGVYDLTPQDMWFMGSAEGLNVINCMDGPFLGEPDPVSTPDCVLYVSEEQRSNVYGHSGLMGLSSLYFPGTSRWWPLIMDMADEVHAQPGAAVISVHPANSAPFFDIGSLGGTMKARELPLDLIWGKVDGMEVIATDFLVEGGELDLWYRLLNCGLRVPPCAGTDATMNRAIGRPLGCFKVYVRLDPEEFEFRSWLKELFRGETFVTNGPLITEFRVGGHGPGGYAKITSDEPVTLDGRLTISCTFPLRRADIVRNGERLRSFFFRHNESAMDTTFSVTIDESSWVGARVYGDNDSWFTVEDSLFAHTGPVYLELNGERILETEDAEYFLQWVHDLEELADLKGEWSDPAESVRVYTELAKARQYYEALATGVYSGIPGEAETARPASRALSARPNPFTEDATIRFALPKPRHTTLRVYALTGQLVRTLVDASLPAGDHAVKWDGRDAAGHRVGCGVYLCRLDTAGAASTTKLVLTR